MKKLWFLYLHLILLFSIFLSVQVYAYDIETITVTPDTPQSERRIRIINPEDGSDYEPEVVEKKKGDKVLFWDETVNAWKIPKGERLYFDIDDSFAYMVDDGSVFDFEITFCADPGINGYWASLNEFSNGFMEFRYDSTITSTYTGDVFGTSLQGQGNGVPGWRTVTMSVDNAYFDNELESLGGEKKIPSNKSASITGDFWLAATTASRWFNQSLDDSSRDIFVSSISITRHIGENPVTVNAEIEESGNTFEWYKADKPVYLTMKNTLDEQVEFDLGCTATDQYGYAVEIPKQKLTLTPKEERQLVVNINTNKCGLYTFYVYLSSEEGDISSSYGPWKFAVVKTDENGIRDEKTYITFNDCTTGYGTVDTATATADGVDLLAKTNAGGMRINMGIDYAYVNNTDTFHYNWNFRPAIEKAREKNLKLLHTVSFWEDTTSTITNAVEALTTTEHSQEAKDIIDSFLKWVCDEFGDITEYYEIWNESHIVQDPNKENKLLWQAHPEKYPAAYVDLCRIAKESLDKYNPDAKIIAGEVGLLGGTEAESRITFENYYKNGLADVADIVNIHPYSNDKLYEYKAVESKDIFLEGSDIISKYSDKEFKVIASETGYTTGPATTYTVARNEYMQGNLNVRNYLLNRSIGVEAWSLYSMTDNDKGTKDAESEYGIAECTSPRAVTLRGDNLLPKESLVQETAKNYWLAQSDFKDLQVVGDNLYAMSFDSRKFANNDVLVIWTLSGDYKATYDLGVNEIIYSDGYGNEKRMSSADGRYTFVACDRPVYIIGEFDSVNIERSRTVSEFVMDIKGKMELEEAGVPVSIVVVPENCTYPGCDLGDIIYMDEIVTQTQGTFEFKVAVENVGGKVKAYLKADGYSPREIVVGPKSPKIDVYMYSKKQLSYPSPDYVEPGYEYTESYINFDAAIDLSELNNSILTIDLKSNDFEKPPVLYNAFYKNDIMTYVKSATVETDMLGSYTYEVSVPQDIEYDRVKLFVFDGKDNISPLCSCIVVE